MKGSELEHLFDLIDEVTALALAPKPRLLGGLLVGRLLLSTDLALDEFTGKLSPSQRPDQQVMMLPTSRDAQRAAGRSNRHEIEDELDTLLVSGTFQDNFLCTLGHAVISGAGRDDGPGLRQVNLLVAPTPQQKLRLDNERAAILEIYGFSIAMITDRRQYSVEVAQANTQPEALALRDSLSRTIEGIHQPHATFAPAERL